MLAINLETGKYYSLTGESRAIWLMIQNRMPVNEIVSGCVDAYEGSPDIIAGAVHEFLDRLKTEQLIVDSEQSGGDAPSTTPPTAVEKKPLPVFEMSIYTDMQDLLLLDPIHDVEDAGWPMARKEDAKHTEG